MRCPNAPARLPDSLSKVASEAEGGPGELQSKLLGHSGHRDLGVPGKAKRRLHGKGGLRLRNTNYGIPVGGKLLDG